MARACARERSGASRDRGGVSHGGSDRGANSGTDRATDSGTAHRTGRADDGSRQRTETGRRVSRRAPDATPPSPRSILAPLAPERYLLRVTLSRDAHDKLERARALLRHAIPNGDPAAVVDRALTALVEQLEKRKIGRDIASAKARVAASRQASRTRHVPAAVKRAVWARDQGRCAFVGTHGRCEETAFVEFHHVRPFAVGGATDVDNLQLRCRAHNAHEAACYFGEELLADAEEARR